MKKIVVSLMVIVVVLVLIGGGTYAMFSDTETGSGNTFTAGTLNLQVGSADPTTETIAIANLKPTDTGNAANWLVKNLGSLSGTLTIATSAITNNENTRSEVEIAAGDTTDNVGELGTLLKVAFWMDTDKSNDWSSGDYYLKSDGSKVAWQSGESALPAGAYDVLNNYDTKSWTGVQAATAVTDAGKFRVEYEWPDGGSGDNVAQSDSCVFSITFVLNQS